MIQSQARQKLLWIFLPLLLYLVVVGSLGVWLQHDLERAALEFKQEIREVIGEEEKPITLEGLRQARIGLFVLLGAGGLVVLGLSYASHRLSRLRGQRLSDLLRDALAVEGEGDEDGAGDSSPSSLSSPFEYAGRVSKELKSTRRRSSVQRARLSRMAQLVDVGVLLFNSERQPELASASALRLIGEEGDLPSEAITQQLFDALVTQSGELRHEDKVPVTLQTPRGDAHIQLQLFHLDESCDHGFLMLLRDRKVLKALDTDFRLAAQLRGLSRLYMGLTHDLKAPLHAMAMNLALLRASATGEEAPQAKRREWLRIVDEELTRLQKELDRLLAQTAPSRDEVERYDLRVCILEIHALLTPQARQQRVVLNLSMPDTPVWCRGHHDRVKQALLNVALNGLEVAPERSELSIRLTERGGLANIAIQDAGPGIAEEHQKHVFEMHFTTKEHGTGIGLYIARSILEGEGGTLVLAETSAAGTVFESCLPRHETESRA